MEYYGNIFLARSLYEFWNERDYERCAA